MTAILRFNLPRGHTPTCLSRWVGILLVNLCFGSLSAQNLQLIKDIRDHLPGTVGEERVRLLNELTWEYRSAFPDSAIKYGEEALGLARSLKLSRGPATTLNYIGLGYYYKGQYVWSYEYYDRALKEAEASADTVELGYANNNIGRLFSEQGMITESFPYFVKAESFFQQAGEEAGLAYVYQSFAALYKTRNDFVKAETNYQRALAIRRKLGNTRDVMSAMVLIGKLYMEAHHFDDALMYFKKADSAGQVIQDALARAEVKILMAEYYLGKKDLMQAQDLGMEGISYILNFNNVKLVPRGYLVLGQIELEKKRYASAKKFFSIALAVATRMKYTDMKMQAHYFMWRLSDADGHREDALFHSNQYLVLKDSANDLDISGRVARFQFQLEIERKQQENELLKTQEVKNAAIIRQQNQERLGLIMVVILASALFYGQWRHARKRKIAHVALSVQKEEIARINTELSEKVDEISRRNDTLESHLTTLLDFSKSKSINFGSLTDAAEDIVSLTAQSLGVSRVSIWTYNETADSIESNAIYDLKSGKFLDKIVLDLSHYPVYANALRSKRVIDAPNARTDVDTREFADGYLAPLDIHSMLDVVYMLDGQLGGLLCCEQQQQPRRWKPEDIIFASSVSDIISLTYRSVQRREYEKRLRQQSKEIARMNEMLEQRVRERTFELEQQNKQLTEYAFINSHMLRSPVSKILGLIGVMEMDNGQDHTKIMTYLKTACEELDVIVKRITLALDGGGPFDRSVITPDDKRER